MKRSALLTRSSKPSARAKTLVRTKALGRGKPMQSRQCPVSATEALLWDRMAREVGCIACRVAGRPTSEYVSIHHIDGRTKPGCHLRVLPLCAGCHQDGTGNDKSLVAVHPYKRRFEQLYGTQLELLALIHKFLGTTP